MELIIDINDNMFDTFKKHGIRTFDSLNEYEKAIIANTIVNGIPLPKGHGELIDKDTVLDMMNHGILEDYITTMGGVIPADK